MICQYCYQNMSNYAYTEVHIDVILCNPCANKILNVVHKAQYGSYVFWDEEEVRKSKGYVKKRISGKLRTQVYERDEYRCVVCKTHKNLTCDHIFPESKGGETTLENLQTMCKSCNSRKGVKHDLD